MGRKSRRSPKRNQKIIERCVSLVKITNFVNYYSSHLQSIMINAKYVANYLLTLSEPEVGDIISNMKLQKLVYYAQGFHLALYDKPLFEEPILAWEHGPVVESLYHDLKKYGANHIPVPENCDDTLFNEEQKDLLKEVYQVYGQFSAWKLRNMTHSELPWLQTSKNAEIQTDLLKSFFKTLLK